jgi:hypothetical protein
MHKQEDIIIVITIMEEEAAAMVALYAKATVKAHTLLLV